MKLLKNLLVVIAATGMMGSVQAQTDLGILSPTVQQQTGFFASGSFADIFNFSIGAENQTFLGSAAGLSSDGTPTIGSVSDLTFTLFAGSNATGPVQGSVTSATGSVIDLSGALVEGAYSVRVSGLIADGALGGGYALAVSAAPEPAEWMMLLAGLLLVVVVARRKARFMAGGAAPA